MQVNEKEGYTSVGANEKTLVDFPFDLNNLFSMQYSFDQLKMAIEYLARQQGDHQNLINQLLQREPGTTIINKAGDVNTFALKERSDKDLATKKSTGSDDFGDVKLPEIQQQLGSQQSVDLDNMISPLQK